jgi:hypothetical protein
LSAGFAVEIAPKAEIRPTTVPSRPMSMPMLASDER